MKRFSVWLVSESSFFVEEHNLKIIKGRKYFFYTNLPPSVMAGIKEGKIQFFVEDTPLFEEKKDTAFEQKREVSEEKKNEGNVEKLLGQVLDRLERIEKEIKNQTPQKGRKK